MEARLEIADLRQNVEPEERVRHRVGCGRTRDEAEHFVSVDDVENARHALDPRGIEMRQERVDSPTLLPQRSAHGVGRADDSTGIGDTTRQHLVLISPSARRSLMVGVGHRSRLRASR